MAAQSSKADRRSRRLGRREFLRLTGGAMVLAAAPHIGAIPVAPRRTVVEAAAACAPGWQSTVLIDSESLAYWSEEHDTGSSATLGLVPGLMGQAVELSWDLGTGNWAQAKYTFPQPQDLSQADIFGVSLRGGGAAEIANTVAIMLADENDVFYGYDMTGKSAGVNQIGRWLINLAFPKKALYFFFSFGAATQIDWSRINRFFLVVKRLCVGSAAPGALECFGGGSGRLALDHVQVDTAANWPRQTQFATVSADAQAAASAIGYLLSQQDPTTGLFVSWKEEELANPPPKSWLYDQALVLIALSREGAWQSGAAVNAAAQAATRLAAALTAKQKPDGHWARSWNPRTGQELTDDGWVGDQAWWVMALSSYARRVGDAATMSSAQRGASWLAAQIDATGKVVGSTEGNVDVWWAMVAASRFADANRIKDYLLNPETAWDADLRYWWRGANDPMVAMDTATWTSLFARHPLVNQPERGKAALSFVRRTLVTGTRDGSLCGFDGMGPVSIWNEGTAQYVAAGGEDAQTFLDMLLSRQNPDGSLPGSPEPWSTDTFGWLTPWRGLAPTAWLYFALTGAPFPTGPSVFLPLMVHE